MRTLLLFFTLLTFSIAGQSYCIGKIVTVVNGEPAPMKGVPGDLFACTLTFSNSSASPIGVFIDRYQKSIPAYWASCYCYISCNSPLQDTITVDIEPFSTRVITVQFKTDSVNPGLATSQFRLFQWGLANITQTLNMTATTMSDVGLKELNINSNCSIFPNPATNKVSVSLANDFIRAIKVLDVSGKLIAQPETNESSYGLQLADYPKGILFIEVIGDKNSYHKILINE